MLTKKQGRRYLVQYNDYPLILYPKHVQEILGWSKDQVYNLFRSKQFPSEKIGSKYIIPKDRFLLWLGKDISAP